MNNKFKFSSRSLKNLEGVDERLVEVVKKAMTITRVDFGVICGLRTLEEQKELFQSGASQTMNSMHLQGKAVDLMAYVGTRASWEITLYDDIADAMAESAKALNVKIRWGASWNIDNIACFDGPMQDAIDSYIAYKRSINQRPFIDGPHFELS